MRESLKIWCYRIGISSIPILVTLATAVFGYSLISTIGDVYSKSLFLVVILGTEIITAQNVETSRGTLLSYIFWLLLACIIWSGFVFRVNLGSIPNGQEITNLSFFILVSIIPSYFIMKRHFEISVYLTPTELEEKEEKDVKKLNDSEPTTAFAGGKKIDV